MTILVGLLHGIDGTKILTPTRVRGKGNSQGFEAQNGVPSPRRQLRGGNLKVTQDVMDEVC